MADKMTCPGCGSHTSAILRAFDEGESCPTCGLSATAAVEIIAVRATRANAEVKAMFEKAVKDGQEWRRRALAAEYRYRRVTDLVGDLEGDVPAWVFGDTP